MNRIKCIVLTLTLLPLVAIADQCPSSTTPPNALHQEWNRPGGTSSTWKMPELQLIKVGWNRTKIICTYSNGYTLTSKKHFTKPIGNQWIGVHPDEKKACNDKNVQICICHPTLSNCEY